MYLIHENTLIKKYLWTDWIVNNQYFGESFFIFYAIAVIIAVFVVCIIIDFIRKKLEKSVIVPGITRIHNKIEEMYF